MGDLNNSATVQITGTIMVIAIIVLFLVVVFVLFLHLYAKWFWWGVEAPPPGRRRRRHALDGHEPVERGLDLCLLRSLPVVIVEGEEEGLECAVCLSEIVVGERGRVLPKCKHGFHVECIDMWFHSHSTCPLCRSSVSDSNNDQKLLVSPTNVPEPAITTLSSSSTNVLVIDVPPPLQMSDSAVEDESKSPGPTRLGSFKRLLSRESDSRMPPTSTSSAHEV